MYFSWMHPLAMGFLTQQFPQDTTPVTQTISNIYEFLRKWLLMHPEYLENQLVIGGESYSGIGVPALAQEIIEGNAAKKYPGLNLQTLVVGNTFTDVHYDINSRVEYAYRVALISEDIFEQAEFQCQGEYVHPNKTNAGCIEDLILIHECLVDLNAAMILENKCAPLSPRPKNLQWDLGSLGLNLTDSLLSEPNPITSSTFCREMCVCVCVIFNFSLLFSSLSFFPVLLMIITKLAEPR